MKTLITLILLGLMTVAALAQNVRVTNPPGAPVYTQATEGNAAVVTPSDSTDLTNPATRGIYIGGAGNVKVDLIGGGTVTFNSLTAGSTLRAGVKRVYSTGTTATNLIALY